MEIIKANSSNVEKKKKKTQHILSSISLHKGKQGFSFKASVSLCIIYLMAWILKKGLARWFSAMVKNPPAVQEKQVQSRCQEDPLQAETATHSSIQAGGTPWPEEPGMLKFMGSQRARHKLATEHEHRHVYL